ncbi:MAG: hypothetical protein JXJ17_06650 [Anaerolineae bacterium]|nr:hypothetical protein [Anaerolineae bacterium]
MTGDVFIPEEYHDYFAHHCAVCHSPITQPKTGRPRRTCSNACRQKLYRDTNLDQLTQRYDRYDDREAEKQIHAWEREFGPIDDTPTADAPGLRWRIKYRLTRGIPVPRCDWCGRPFVVDRNISSVPGCCSDRCQRERTRYRRSLEEAFRRFSPDEIDGVVYVRLRVGGRIGVCAHCGKPFPDYLNGRKYCSKKCSQAAWRKKGKKCPCCGKRFVPVSGKENTQVYCSGRCRDRVYHERLMAERLKPITCQHCGRTFIPARTSYRYQKYCSRQCRDRAYYLRRRNKTGESGRET